MDRLALEDRFIWLAIEEDFVPFLNEPKIPLLRFSCDVEDSCDIIDWGRRDGPRSDGGEDAPVDGPILEIDPDEETLLPKYSRRSRPTP